MRRHTAKSRYQFRRGPALTIREVERDAERERAAVEPRAEAEPGGTKRVLDAIASLEADDHQVLVFSVLGHKAEFGIMAFGKNDESCQIVRPQDLRQSAV